MRDLKKIKLSVILIGMTLLLGSKVLAANKTHSFYQLKIYHLKNGEQVATVDDFLKNAFLPALHRNGINHIGVFKPLSNENPTEQLIYVLIPYKSLEQFNKLEDRLKKDQQYLYDGASYLENVSPFGRIESILLRTFKNTPSVQVPQLKNSRSNRVYELRSYESPSEKIFTNKVEMFNEGGEIEIFDRLGFNAVFYGSVIAGSKMPNLMYMITFEDMAARDQHWQSFGDDAAWKKLSANPIYRNNVSHIDSIFMCPTPYSDL